MRRRDPDDLLRRTPKSIQGLGTSDQDIREHTPVLLTAFNFGRVMAEIPGTIRLQDYCAARLIAISAIEAGARFDEKIEEADREEAAQREEWEQFTAGPLKAEFQALELERQKLVGVAIAARESASAIVARNGMRFQVADLASLEAFQDAIENSYLDADEIRGETQSANLSARVPLWLEGVSAISPLCLCVITTFGLAKLLFGVELTTAFQSPFTILAAALALGITVPSLIWAYRLGWNLATPRENTETAIRSIRSTSALIWGLALLFVATAFLAGIDMMAITAVSSDAAMANSRVGLTADVPWWTPWLGCGFTLAGVAAKAWAGYCDSIQKYQDDLITAVQRSQVERVRADLSEAITHIATADMAEARLTEIKERQDELSDRLGELVFVAEFSEELIEETAVERNTWIGESRRFWALVWATHPLSTDLEASYSTWDQLGASVRSFLFGGRR